MGQFDGMLRHVGKIKNTDSRCVVAFMRIPGNESHALVINTENLPDRAHQALMSVVEKTKAQQAEVLANVLSTEIMPDTGINILESFHRSGHLIAVPVDNVIMMPRNNMNIPLVDILGSIDLVNAEVVDTAAVQAVENKFNNSYETNRNAHTAEQAKAIADNLLIEAQMLEHDAAAKREQAYRINPTARPKNAELPQLTAEQNTAVTTEILQEIAKPKTSRRSKAS